ncbi:TGF beta receptor associated protein 1 [Aspergillus sclerotioniger CBS 115572]|uniref:TGF beta receptor associated protein 1 n=1 Tax=Aspergillus sclerotioniger CBS 115572 TaxID=1450535 RepID=A0A317WRH7_9EURO|nr:TGF beta receptor associated protein 1 [Aspergillus sclerotioniger CBS 115572]PWY88615.1 TGF beta receptor associated protein 1 [Aspergillus sclerotioniger CBS 115572]
MVSEEEGVSPRKRRKIGPPKAAPYVFRSLFDQVPLNADNDDDDVHITWVEYWNDNLYIGTSAAEILHFVCLPPDPSDKSNEPSFILASRLPIPFSQTSSAKLPGIQQIVLLPTVNKACVLCNGTATFYMLPELSPAFGNTKVSSCRWIGGLDLNAAEEFESPVVMIAASNRIMLVRIGDDARRIRNIEFPGCLVASRRGPIACAADTHAYSLLDVENQQKIQLFPVSFSSEMSEAGQMEARSPSSPFASSPVAENHAHDRSFGPNTFAGMLQPKSQPTPHDRSTSVTPELSPVSGTPRRSISKDRAESASPRISPAHSARDSQPSPDDRKPLPAVPKQPPTQLKPHVLSPTPSEFLLVRGTDATEPGVGMFVNVDGDVVRGTITFHKYPESIVIDKGDENHMIPSPENTHEELLLAVIESETDGQPRKFLEVQLWDVDPAEAEDHKTWVEIPSTHDTQPTPVGLCHTLSPSKLEISELGDLLRMVRLKTPLLSPHVPAHDPRTQASIEQLQKEKELSEAQVTDSDGSKKGEHGWEVERNAEEARFARELGQTQSSMVMWNGNQIWRVVRNPLTTQLNDALQNAQEAGTGDSRAFNRNAIADIIHHVQTTEPKSESEFLGLNYVKQKASLLLFADLVFMDPAVRKTTIIDDTERALIVGNLDPRIALLLVPLLRREVLQGPQGIWVHAGLAEITEAYVQQLEKTTDSSISDSAVLDMLKRFLFSWQQKRGYGSITDETYVFDSVDAAILHLILEQDAQMSAEQRSHSSIRAELNRLVDNWKGNFDRAVALLESYRRLFVLSRLYQSQKMSRNVLKTWRRIIEGEEDRGGEVTIAGTEAQMRRYLVKIKDVQLVEEYGAWLAQRNPTLGIQVFSDGTSRVKLETLDVVRLLKEHAPNAVQAYLEHLVFVRNHTQYADDLLSYYLDTVLSVLESSPEARASLAESYSTYRALQPPKPTYMNFITENTPAEPWWQSRLRLLQLLGGGSGGHFSSLPSRNLTYSIPAVLARIEPFQKELVSESVILDGLQGRHREALHLLTHGLGDYDSAVRYCLFGGPRSTSSTGALAEFADRTLQSELFRYLLDEFLHIQDPSERIERTSDLLGRFAAWFDVGEVLRVVPDDWSVDILSGFLGHVFRVLISEGREVRIERALSAGLNLRIGTEYIAGVEKVGGWVEDEGGLRRLKEGAAKAEEAKDLGSDFGDMVGADAAT